MIIKLFCNWYSYNKLPKFHMTWESGSHVALRQLIPCTLVIRYSQKTHILLFVFDALWWESTFDIFLGLGTHLFVKIPRPGDSEVTFSVFQSIFNFLR